MFATICFCCFEKKFTSINRKIFTNVFVVESFNIRIIKNSKSFDKLFIIYFFVDFKSNIDTKYEYREWNYVKAIVFFFENVISKMCCLDIDVDVILINKKFLKTQTLDIQIRIIAIFFSVRELNINRYFTFEYVVVFIYFVDKNTIDKKIKTCFRREIHIVDDLKTNMLIENHIIDSKNFIINLNKKIARINNCDVIVSIEIQSFKLSTIQLFVHLKKIIVISIHVELTIFIHRMKNILFVARDFLFESKFINQLSMYAHLIDATTKTVIVRNNNNTSMQISRNMRLNRIFELNYSNVFFADNENEQENDEIRELTIKRLVSKYKTKWFRKMINICVIAFAVIVVVFLLTKISSVFKQIDVALSKMFIFNFLKKIFINISIEDVQLFNDVIIYNFDKKTIDFFQ